MKIDLNDYIDVTWTPYTETDERITSIKTILKQCKLFRKSFEELQDKEGVEQAKSCEVNIINCLNDLMEIKSNKTISDLDNKEDLI